MLYYFMAFLIYSMIGFTFESFIFKINNSNRHSGIFYGPITGVYGIGAVMIMLLNKYLFKKFKFNKYINLILEYVILVITLSIVEFTGGNLVYYLFHINMWDYSNHRFHLGKYLCLEYSLLWGVFGLLLIYYVNPFIKRIIKRLGNKVKYFLVLTFTIDCILVLIYR